MSAKIDVEVGRIIEAGYKTAESVMKKLRKRLDKIAEELIKKETLDADDFVRLMGPKVIPAIAKKA